MQCTDGTLETMEPGLSSIRRWLVGTVFGIMAISACGSEDPADSGSTISTRPTTPTSSSSSSSAAETPTAANAAPATAVQPGPTLPVVALNDVSVHLEEVAFAEQPLDMATRPGDRSVYIAEKTGRILRLPLGTSGAVLDPIATLDLSGVVSTNSERGLLGIAFGPAGRLYTSYSDSDGDSVISSWSVQNNLSTGAADVDLDSENVHLTLDQPFSNHNGGDIAFGPDGYLYIGFGDGGSADDPLGAGQDTTSLLGAMLRIEPTINGYEVPADNPFVANSSARPELYIIGLRNPWRFSFDTLTGDLWIGDVGQNTQEEIDLLPAGQAGGSNLGWNNREGDRTFDGGTGVSPLASTLSEPLLTYGRDEGVSVTGGLVVRDPNLPDLDGAYLYADFGAGWIRSVRVDNGTIIDEAQLFSGVGSISAFGAGPAGEVYVMAFGGSIFQVIAD